jgi:hypothetical protein
VEALTINRARHHLRVVPTRRNVRNSVKAHTIKQVLLNVNPLAEVLDVGSTRAGAVAGLVAQAVGESGSLSRFKSLTQHRPLAQAMRPSLD